MARNLGMAQVRLQALLRSNITEMLRDKGQSWECATNFEATDLFCSSYVLSVSHVCARPPSMWLPSALVCHPPCIVHGSESELPI